MTDRHEAVAKAIFEADVADELWDSQSADSIEHYTELADAALAVIAASEPTEAEIEAAINKLSRAAIAFGRAGELLDSVALGGEMGFDDARDELVEAKKDLIALIAARKAGQP